MGYFSNNGKISASAGKPQACCCGGGCTLETVVQYNYTCGCAGIATLNYDVITRDADGVIVETSNNTRIYKMFQESLPNDCCKWYEEHEVPCVEVDCVECECDDPPCCPGGSNICNNCGDCAPDGICYEDCATPPCYDSDGSFVLHNPVTNVFTGTIYVDGLCQDYAESHIWHFTGDGDCDGTSFLDVPEVYSCDMPAGYTVTIENANITISGTPLTILVTPAAPLYQQISSGKIDKYKSPIGDYFIEFNKETHLWSGQIAISNVCCNDNSVIAIFDIVRNATPLPDPPVEYCQSLNATYYDLTCTTVCKDGGTFAPILLAAYILVPSDYYTSALSCCCSCKWEAGWDFPQLCITGATGTGYQNVSRPSGYYSNSTYDIKLSCYGDPFVENPKVCRFCSEVYGYFGGTVTTVVYCPPEECPPDGGTTTTTYKYGCFEYDPNHSVHGPEFSIRCIGGKLYCGIVDFPISDTGLQPIGGDLHFTYSKTYTSGDVTYEEGWDITFQHTTGCECRKKTTYHTYKQLYRYTQIYPGGSSHVLRWDCAACGDPVYTKKTICACDAQTDWTCTSREMPSNKCDEDVVDGAVNKYYELTWIRTTVDDYCTNCSPEGGPDSAPPDTSNVCSSIISNSVGCDGFPCDYFNYNLKCCNVYLYDVVYTYEEQIVDGVPTCQTPIICSDTITTIPMCVPYPDATTWWGNRNVDTEVPEDCSYDPTEGWTLKARRLQFYSMSIGDTCNADCTCDGSGDMGGLPDDCIKDHLNACDRAIFNCPVL